jgi:signal recognition particle subunit SEC65
MSNMNNPMSRATKAEIKAARKDAKMTNVPATIKAPATTAIVVKAKATPKAPKEKAVDDPTKFTIAALARELEKDPKTVRARLRRMYDQDKDHVLPRPVEGRQRWTYNVSDKDAMTKILSAE